MKLMVVGGKVSAMMEGMRCGEEDVFKERSWIRRWSQAADFS